jgi:signal transduction histidine kinase
MAVPGDDDGPVKGDNLYVVTAGRWRRVRAEYADGPTDSPSFTPVPAAARLGTLGVAESILRSTLDGVSMQGALVLCLVALATTLPPAFLAPQAAAITVVSASVVSVTLFHTLTVAALITQPIVLYRLARDGEPRIWAQRIAVCLPIAFLVLALTHPVSTGSEAGVLTVLLVFLAPAAAFAGIAQRARAEVLIHEAAREAAAGDLLEHAARGERARIARELHDVVAHHISMIAVQAETARVSVPGMPVAGAKRLSAIGDTARAALTEMRRLLGVLREDAGADEPELVPQPGLGQLNELLDQARETSGSGARLILRGAPAARDPGVELAAYRIVQEALTNARRHAPGAAVDVELHYAGDVLRLRVRDNGPGPPGEAGAAAGHGLSGMRERAAVVGGGLHTGPAPGGGFLVEAILPTKNGEAVK